MTNPIAVNLPKQSNPLADRAAVALQVAARPTHISSLAASLRCSATDLIRAISADLRFRRVARATYELRA